MQSSDRAIEELTCVKRHGVCCLTYILNDMIKRLFILPVVALVLLTAFTVRADEASDYKAFVEETKAWVYSMDLPAFEVRDVPEKYKDESAVYIAIYNGLDIRRNTTAGRLPGTLRYSSDKRLEGGDLQRVLVQINDQSALEEFSEYDFSTDVTLKYDMARKKRRQVLGVKVIKPDGREIEVDTEEYVDVKEGKKNKRTRQKLAVPGLEIGDKVDMFAYVSHDIHNTHLEPMVFMLREKYPVMDYTVRLIIDGTLSSFYRSLNGAPDFTGTRDGEGNFRLEMKLEDIPAKPRLYYSDEMQSPLVKLFVYNPDAESYIPPSAKVIGLLPNPEAGGMKHDLWEAWNRLYYKESGVDFLKKALKNGGKAAKRLSEAYKSGEKSIDEVADCAYNLLTYGYYASGYGLMPLWFDIQMSGLMHGLVGDSLKHVMTTLSTNESIDELASFLNAETGVGLPDGKRFYFCPRSVLAPNELNPSLAGRRSQYFYNFYGKEMNANDVAYDTLCFNLPESRPARNRETVEMNVKLDGMTLDINRKVTTSGLAKMSASSLLTTEDLLNAYQDYFNAWGIDVIPKEDAKKAAERQSRYADARLEQKSDFEAEVKDYHGDIEADAVDGRILAVGIDPKSSKLVYEVGYKAGGLVKRAGGNMLLSVGQLTGSYPQMLDKDRTREDAVVSKGAREYVTHTVVQLPEGMKVSETSLDGLNRSVTNGAGVFSVSARVDDDVLVVDVIRRFNRRLMAASSWPEMVELIDAASAWQAATVLVEK